MSEEKDHEEQAENELGELEDASQVPLASRVDALREQNKTDQEIARAILQEDFEVDVGELASLLEMKILDVGRIKGALGRSRKQHGKPVKEEKGEKEPTHAAEPSSREETVYKEEPNPNKILDDILSTHPDILPKVRAELMDWARLKGSLDPQGVAYLLSNMRGITANTANIVANKYALALQKAQQEGKSQFSMGPMMMGVDPYGRPYYLQNNPGMGNPQSGPPDFRAELREEMRRLREDLKPKDQQPEQLIEIEEPLRGSDGAVVTDKDGHPLTKTMRVPVSMAGRFAPAEDAEERVLRRMKLQKELFKPDSAPLTEEKIAEKIRSILRDELPREKERSETAPVSKEDLAKATKEAADEAVKRYAEQAEKEKKEDERFARLENAIREAQGSRSADGYKEDTFRFMSQGLNEVSKTLKEVVERKPLEGLLDRGEKLLFSSGPAGPKDVEANSVSAEEKFFARLDKQGLVSEH